jgi:hypothetical protein
MLGRSARAGWQAAHAKRTDIRRASRTIHHDETSHAELAWAVHAWILERLTDEERELVKSAMAEAVGELRRGARNSVPEKMVLELGLPRAYEAEALVLGLESHVWTAAAA